MTTIRLSPLASSWGWEAHSGELDNHGFPNREWNRTMTSGPPAEAGGARVGAGGGRPGRPVWPSLEEQLSSDEVSTGSALERLIRDNQDFGMLRPEEATDRLRIPLWLRVYFRKEHPEGDYSGPGGGYP